MWIGPELGAAELTSKPDHMGAIFSRSAQIGRLNATPADLEAKGPLPAVWSPCVDAGRLQQPRFHSRPVGVKTERIRENVQSRLFRLLENRGHGRPAHGAEDVRPSDIARAQRVIAGSEQRESGARRDDGSREAEIRFSHSGEPRLWDTPERPGAGA